MISISKVGPTAY